ncbi:unnamed protein product, partial [Symbiodinium sp. CCMP2456]
MLAAQLNDTKAVDWMLEQDPSIGLKTNRAGQTGMMWASWWNSPEMMQIFRKHKLQQTHRDQEGVNRLKDARKEAEDSDDLATLSLLRVDPTELEAVGTSAGTGISEVDENLRDRMGDQHVAAVQEVCVYFTVDNLIAGFEMVLSDGVRCGQVLDEQGQLMTPDACERLQSKRVVPLNGHFIRQVRSWDAKPGDGALCARLEFVTSAKMRNELCFPDDSRRKDKPDFQFPQGDMFGESQVCELHFDGRGRCVDVTTTAVLQGELRGLSMFGSLQGDLHSSSSMEHFLLHTLLPQWEKASEQRWPPQRQNMLGWSDGSSMKGFVETAKLFVLKAIAEGSAAKPSTIFALHIHTLQSRLNSECIRAMRSHDPRLRRLWAPYIKNVFGALQACPRHNGFAFRTVTFEDGDGSSAPCVEHYLKDKGLEEGAEVTWLGFTTATSSPSVASNLLLGLDCEKSGRSRNSAGVIYKVLDSRAVSVKDFTNFPEKQELLFEPDSKFR